MINHFGKGCQFFIITKRSPKYLFKRNKSIYFQTSLYKSVHSIFFTIAPSWEQPTYPSVGEWANKLWYIPTVEYYPMKRNKLLICITV